MPRLHMLMGRMALWQRCNIH